MIPALEQALLNKVVLGLEIILVLEAPDDHAERFSGAADLLLAVDPSNPECEALHAMVTRTAEHKTLTDGLRRMASDALIALAVDFLRDYRPSAALPFAIGQDQAGKPIARGLMVRELLRLLRQIESEITTAPPS